MMRNTSISIFAVAIAATCSAATRTWTGAGGDNEWTNTLNWADSTMATGNDTAIFTNDVPLNLRLNYPDGYYGAQYFRFLGKDVTFGSDESRTLYIYGPGIISTVEVVTGTIVAVPNYIHMYHSNNLGLEKTGGGVFRYAYGGNPGSLKQVIVSGGTFDIRPRVGVTTSYEMGTATNIHVGADAVFSISGYTNFKPGIASPAVVSIDGGTLVFGMSNVENWFHVGESTSHAKPDIFIGAGGGVIRTTDLPSFNSDSCRVRIYSQIEKASGVATDGGLTLDLRDNGVTVFPINPFLLNGPVSVLDGRLQVGRIDATDYSDLSSNPDFFGTGDFTLDCSMLIFKNEAGDIDPSVLKLASGVGTKMTVRGASTVSLRESTSKNRQHIVVGPDGATAGAAFVRERGAALFLCDDYGDFDGSGSTFKVSGGMGAEAETLVRVPIFVTKGESGHVGANFVRYDEDKGFVEFTDYYTASLVDAGENSVVGNQYPSLAANAAAHVAGVRLPAWGTLTLNAGSCLTIGNGTDPACLLLGYEAKVSGTGTINFGNSEGVITIGTKFYDDGGHGLPCRLTGSGGVSYLASAAYGKRVANVSGANDYTGDTHISVATILPRNELAFSSGDVYVEGGYRNGGKIAFDRPLTFANAFHVSGTGHRADMYSKNLFGYGALTFLTNDVVLTGTVELTAKTDVSAMPAGSCGTFAGAISGDKLCVCEGEGSIILAANNTYTGGTEVVSAKIALAGTSPSLGTGRVKLDDGIVLFENTSPITFANPVEGNGTFRVLGSDVTFTVPQIKGGSPTVATAGTRVEFANGVARIIHPHGMAIVFK